MKKRTTRFLNISLILVSLFCVSIFFIQTFYINLMGENAIRQLGVFYMSGISEQVSSHFGTTIELRLLLFRYPLLIGRGYLNFPFFRITTDQFI